jgi:ribonucleoside-diphosphate reductase alpha chain
MDALANTQQTKGKRRRRGGLEESNLIDKDVLEDAVIPVFNTPRRTAGNLIDPEELNGWIGRFTTSGYKNSNEYDVITNICKKMVNMDGGFLIGSDWRLPVYFGRQKFSTINEAREGSLSSFKMNYLCQWIGNSNASLVGINHLINARKLEEFELEILKDKRGRPVISEFVIAVDVARSVSDANNQTAIAVLKITRNLKNKIESIDVVNIKTPSNGLNFTEQALEVKKMFVRYGGSWDLSSSMVKAVVVDSNGIGQGLVEKLLEETRDPETGQIFPAFATINTDEKFEGEEAPNILFSLKSQGINSDIINKFIDYVEGDKLRLIKPWSKIKPDKELFSEEEESCSLFCDQTQRFIDQVANLKLEQASNGKNSVKQVIKKIDKDIFSAIEYGIYYIDMFLQNEIDESEYDYVFNTSTF